MDVDFYYKRLTWIVILFTGESMVWSCDLYC